MIFAGGHYSQLGGVYFLYIPNFVFVQTHLDWRDSKGIIPEVVSKIKAKHLFMKTLRRQLVFPISYIRETTRDLYLQQNDNEENLKLMERFIDPIFFSSKSIQSLKSSPAGFYYREPNHILDKLCYHINELVDLFDSGYIEIVKEKYRRIDFNYAEWINSMVYHTLKYYEENDGHHPFESFLPGIGLADSDILRSDQLLDVGKILEHRVVTTTKYYDEFIRGVNDKEIKRKKKYALCSGTVVTDTDVEDEIESIKGPGNNVKGRKDARIGFD